MCRCRGCLRPGARPPPAACPPRGLLGPDTHLLLACGLWGPSTVPLAAFMPCGGLRAAEVVGGRPGGVALHCCEGGLVSGAVPLPAAGLWGRAARTCCPGEPGTGAVGMGDAAQALAARPQGGLSGSATHLLWAWVCGRGGPAMSLWLACPAGGCVPPGWWGANPWGLSFHRCKGRLVSGAVCLPATHPLGRAARTRCLCVPGTGGVGMGGQALAPQRALLRAGVARCGGVRRAFRKGMPFGVVRGV